MSLHTFLSPLDSRRHPAASLIICTSSRLSLSMMSPSPPNNDYSSFASAFSRPHFPSAHPGVAHILLSSPSTLNAVTPSNLAQLPALFFLLASDPSVKIIVISGSGPAFSSGLDLSSATAPDSLLHYARSAVPPSSTSKSPHIDVGAKRKELKEDQPDPASIAQTIYNHVRDLQSCLTAIATCPKPVIAAIHGPCLGAGLDLACCADIRLAAPSATFSVREVHLGLAADLGVLSRLPKIVGSANWVKEVCLTGRMISAEEAGLVGLVKVVDKASHPYTGSSKSQKEEEASQVLNAAFALAHDLTTLPQIAVLGTKEILDYTVDHSVDESLRYTRIWNSAMLQTREIPEAIAKAIADKQKRARSKKGAKL